MAFRFSDFLTSGCIVPYPSEPVQVSGPRFFWVGWGHPRRESRSCPFSLSMYAPDFFLQDLKPWFCFEHFAVMEERVLLEECRRFCGSSLSSPSHHPMAHPLDLKAGSWNQSLHSRWKWEGPQWSVWEQLFEQVHEQLRLGTFQKVVPVLFQKSALQPDQIQKAAMLFQVLSFTRPWPLAVYGLWGFLSHQNHQESGLLGATPELLFKYHQGICYTVAVAGTRLKSVSSLSQRSSEPFLPLLQDPKERKEHELVIEGICQSLKEFIQDLGAKGASVEVQSTQEVEFPTLSHLVTPILCHVDEGVTEPGVFEEWVRRLHPTPALGTSPKEPGMPYLRTLDAHYGPRGRLGAPFGFQSPHRQSEACYVGIRHLEWGSLGSRVGAGCGLILASRMRAEWEEILGKIRSVQKTLGVCG